MSGSWSQDRRNEEAQDSTMKRADHTELKNYETLIRIEIKTKDLDFGYEIAKFRHCLLAG